MMIDQVRHPNLRKARPMCCFFQSFPFSLAAVGIAAWQGGVPDSTLAS